MGGRGPKKEPSAIQKAKGNPSKRSPKIVDLEPKPPHSELVCPNWLDQVARGKWDFIVSALSKMETTGQKLITKLDVDILAVYCQSYSDYVHAHNKLMKEGGGRIDIVSFDKKGGKYVQQSPFVGMKTRAAEQMIKYAAHLGFSPSSRVGVQLVPSSGDQQSELDKIVFGKSS